ncbi:MAG: quinol dehydrogenase ferredoxin subunit NapH [Gammaproteobacteria bacterium]|nr:quinol dehydrogenase ferredoxin subunit NapH [Gammaproteobacteria bacterium]
MARKYPVAHEAIATKGWLGAHRWLILRRLSQFGILGLFLLGPLAGLWIVKGNLAASLTLDVLPLTDPYVFLQMLLARHWPELSAIIGALLVLGFYALVGGRVYCSWVCPVNIVTDTAAWLRRRLGLRGGTRLAGDARYWVLAMTLLMSAAFGVIIWEYVNPVSMLQRGLIFGLGAAWVVILGIFFFDLFVTAHGWCSHLCPVGAFYSLVGSKSVVRVSAPRRAACDDCMDCFAVCPEPEVIPPALRGAKKGVGPVILDSLCTNCGRCIDVCSKDVFEFSTRFNNRLPAAESVDPVPGVTEERTSS